MIQITTRWLWLCLLINVLGVGACTQDKNESDEGAIVDVLVSPRELLITRFNKEFRLIAVAKNSQNSPVNEQPNFTWQSSDPNVVSVDDKGVLVAHANSVGDVIITASFESYVRTAKIQVDNTSSRAIMGVIRYQDKAYDKNGFTRINEYKPVRYARVDLLDKEGFVIDEVSTNTLGEYVFRDAIPSEFFVRVLAESNNRDVSFVTVNDLFGALWAYESPGDWYSIDQDKNIDIPVTSPLSGVFNMLDVYMIADLGTYFCTQQATAGSCLQGAGIYIISIPDEDTDEFDDDVLLHEYGHFFANALSKDDSLGGAHDQYDNDLDLRLAWSEGLGNFFTVAVKRWMDELQLITLSTDALGQYVDTDGVVAANISIDVERPDDQIVYGSSSEGAVAKILTEIRKDEGLKQSMWNVLTSFAVLDDTRVVNLELFWDEFMSVDLDGQQHIQLDEIFHEREVYFHRDKFEAEGDDSISALPRTIEFGMPGEQHTLYQYPGGADIDLIAFNTQLGKIYHIQTFDLMNGSDTKLRLLNDQGEPVIINGSVLENDNNSDLSYIRQSDACDSRQWCVERPYNDELSLASGLSFIAENDALYFVEVTGSTAYAQEAGRYGTYSIKIEVQ